MVEDLIFYESEESLNRTILLAIGAKQQEKVLEDKIKSLIPNSQIKKVDDLKSTLELIEANDHENIDLVITLRKNSKGGVEDPVGIIKQIKESFPDSESIFIVGNEDEQGKKMISELDKLKSKIITALSGKPVSISQIEEAIKEIINRWSNYEQVQTAAVSIYSIQSVKGGTGVTTVTIQLAHYFVSQEKKVLILDGKGGVGYWYGLHFSENQFLHLDDHTDVYFKPENFHWQDWKDQYDVILMDGMKPGLYEAQIIFVIDPTQEAIYKTKSQLQATDKVILNQAVPDLMPVEVIEQEIGHEINLVIHHDRHAAILAEANNRPNLIDFDWLQR